MSKAKDKHGFLFLTVDENTKPLRIEINRDGQANADAFVKNLKKAEENKK